MPSSSSQSCCSKLQPHLVPAVPDQKNWKQQRSSPVKTPSFSSEGSKVLRRKWSRDVGMLLWARLRRSRGEDVYAVMGGIVHYRCTLWVLLQTALCPSSFDSVVGPVRMCLVSGRVRNASRNAAGRYESNATGVANLVTTILLQGMAKKGKGPKGPSCCASAWRPAWGCGGALAILPLLMMGTCPPKTCSRRPSSPRASLQRRTSPNMMPPPPKKGGAGEAP